MKVSHLCLATATAAALAFTAPARAEVFDGITHAQFRSVVTNMGIEAQERTTSQGNSYFLLHVPNTNIAFAATTSSCVNGQASPCIGFAYFLVVDRKLADQDGFNTGAPFIKAHSSSSGNGTTFVLENFAKGGVTDVNVATAAGFFAGMVTQINGGNTASLSISKAGTPAFTSMAQANSFFANLAKQSPLGAGEKPAEMKAEALGAAVDQLAAAHAK